MSEIWISMREKKLTNTLTLMTEALTLVTKERDRLSALADKWNLECDEMREDNKRLAAENAKLREALKNLLEDTQHAEHEDCEDGPCPVREARAVLKGKA